MPPDQTFGELLVTEPFLQIAVALSGALLLWYEIRDIRKRLNASSSAGQHAAIINLCNDLIGRRAKVFAAAVIAIQFGLCLLLAGTQIVSAEIALGLFAIVVFTTVIPAAIYFMFWGAPVPVLRWLLRDLVPSASKAA